MTRILVVEDDLAACQTYAHLLRHAGHDVDTATSGASALSSVRRHAPGLVLADLFLGDLTAIELMQDLRRARCDTPVIVLTGMATVQTAVAAMKLGAADYLTKPVDFDEVLHAVNLVVSERRLGGEPLGYAASRWAQAVAGLLPLPHDVRNIEQWGRAIGASPGALKNWCLVARLPARRSLILGRLLRAVVRSEGRPWEPHQVLNVAEPRTLDHMLAIGGLSRRMLQPSVAHVLAHQRAITDPLAIEALRAAIHARRLGC
jgi:ActR/RegA family two-component response regulator